MANIFAFKSQSVKTAEENLSSFIVRCRKELTVFGADLNWDASVWNGLAVFSKLGITTRKPDINELLDIDYIDFAKAYFRYQQGHNPTGTKNELKALRAIESALLQVNGNASIHGLSIDCLNEAVVLANQHYSKGAAYQCGREIQRLANFVTIHHFVPANLKTWKTPIPRPSDTVKTGIEAKAKRERKLPNEIALNALAEIFANKPENQRDIFTTSVFAMLLSAPSRISEVLALPADCEVIEIDRDGIERYGWRFYSGKGFQGDIKWIPSVMVEVAKTAVNRAKLLSSEARNLAIWIENNPDKFYRHPKCPKVLDHEPLTVKDVLEALGFSNESLVNSKNILENRGLSTLDGFYTLNSLWKHVLKKLPPDFPWFDKERGIKYSNALFVLNVNQLHEKKTCLPVELQKPTNNFFNNDLGPRECLVGAHKSIFDRHGYLDQNGDKLKLTSHQARHLLNTIAQRGGLSNFELAKWSGRADLKQNRTYNHMSEYEFIAMAEKIDTSKSLFGPLGIADKYLPVSSQEFNTLEHAAVHVTEYGFCVHDYTISPCEKYRDCINCTEQVCIKGDLSKLNSLKNRLNVSDELLQKANKATEIGEAGADRWFAYHQKTVARLRELLSILENPNIADNAQIKLKGNDFSQLSRVFLKQESKVNKEVRIKEKEEIKFLEDLRTTFGGEFG